jgi:hypothetical protein
MAEPEVELKTTEPVAQAPIIEAQPDPAVNARRRRPVTEIPKPAQAQEKPAQPETFDAMPGEVCFECTVKIWTKNEVICNQLYVHNSPDSTEPRRRNVGLNAFASFIHESTSNCESKYFDWCNPTAAPVPPASKPASAAGTKMPMTNVDSFRNKPDIIDVPSQQTNDS